MKAKDKILAKILHGSKLYGTANEDSDTDMKGCFLPSMDSCLLNKAAKSINVSGHNTKGKNTKEDVDCQLFSLQNLVHLGCKGEMNVIDMIHAGPEFWLEHDPIWEEVYKNRSKFYTKSMYGFMGYILSMTRKYSERTNRYKAACDFLKLLESFQADSLLKDNWDKIEEDEYVKKITIDHSRDTDPRAIEICGSKMIANFSIEVCRGIVKGLIDRYGSRVTQAETGADWKAISHAYRAAYQLLEIVETGDLTFPLKEASYLKRMKEGEFDWHKDGIGEKLDELTEKVRKGLDNSSFPAKVNVKFWEEFILEAYQG